MRTWFLNVASDCKRLVPVFAIVVKPDFYSDSASCFKSGCAVRARCDETLITEKPGSSVNYAITHAADNTVDRVGVLFGVDFVCHFISP
jgi:hypothetical protein